MNGQKFQIIEEKVALEDLVYHLKFKNLGIKITPKIKEQIGLETESCEGEIVKTFQTVSIVICKTIVSLP